MAKVQGMVVFSQPAGVLAVHVLTLAETGIATVEDFLNPDGYLSRFF